MVITRSLVGTELPQHGADCVDVCALVYALASSLLRRHVGGSAEDRACGGEAVVVDVAKRAAANGRLFGCAEVFRETPVDDDGLTEVTNDDVRGLEIAMDNVAAVRVGDSVCDGDDLMEQADPLIDSRALGEQIAQ